MRLHSIHVDTVVTRASVIRQSIVSETFKRINAERKGTCPPYLHTILFLRGEIFFHGENVFTAEKKFLRGEKVSIVEKMFLHGENIFSM